MKRPGRSALSAPAPEPALAARPWPWRAIVAGVFLAVLLAYWPSLRGEFLWDDAGHVTHPELQSWSGLARIWFEPGATQQYYPLLHTAFWLEHRLWGDAAVGYHFINVLWHATAASLLIVVLRRLAIPGALLAGLLFALHPVAVESVAWIAEQKNTLSTVFYLAAALAWLRFVTTSETAAAASGALGSVGPRGRPGLAYALASVAFLAALLTKTVTATLPAALLVVAWWRRGRLSWRHDVRPLLPWLAVGVGAGLFTVHFERVGIGADGADFELSALERGLLAGRVFWFYLGKLVWPVDLTFFYPRWQIDAGAAGSYLYPLAGLALLAALIGWSRSGRGRGPFAAFLIFGGSLFPVLGFVNVYPFIFSYVADHFQYLASLSLFALAAAALTTAARRAAPKLPRGAAPGSATALLVLLGGLTWRQSRDYVDAETLYRATLQRNPESWVAHLNLGAELSARGAPHEALPHTRRAVELKPDYPPALNNLAHDLTRTGRPTEALPPLERALQLQPNYAEAHNTRGIAWAALGRRDEAVAAFEQAIALQPNLAEAHYNLGLAKAEQGDLAAAIPHFATTVRLQPDHADAELNWGIALLVTGQPAAAAPRFARALELRPESAALRQSYGRALMSTGDVAAAVPQFQAALSLDPTRRDVHRDLALALQRLGRLDEARQHARLANGEG